MKNATPNLDWNLRVCGQALLVCAVFVCAFFVWGCTYNRNAPLISAPLINANGNTVPLVKP